MLSAGTASASGQQDVGHEGVATGRRGFSLPSLKPLCGVFRRTKGSRWGE